MIHRFLAVSLALLLFGGDAWAQATPPPVAAAAVPPAGVSTVAPAVPPEDYGTFALGPRLGIFPPIFSALEFDAYLNPYVALGLIGVYSPKAFGSGGASFLGGATVRGTLKPGDSEYLESSYYHYHADADSTGYTETSDFIAITTGYLWRWSVVELQAGVGIQFVLRDEVPPCLGVTCTKNTAWFLPAVDLALRFRL